MARRTETETQARARLNAEILEAAKDAHAGGVVDDATYEKITMRQLARAGAASLTELTGEDIRALREKANMSQAVFARYLHLTPGYVSRLERGAMRPTGPVLVLLDVVRRLGIDAVIH